MSVNREEVGLELLKGCPHSWRSEKEVSESSALSNIQIIMLILIYYSFFKMMVYISSIIAENIDVLLHHSRCLYCFQHLKSQLQITPLK